MNDEQILEQQTEKDGSRISLTDILYVLRAHLLLIIIITVLFAAGGVAYSKVRKPVYTASVPVQFDVIVKALDEHGAETDKDNEVASTNYLFRYIESAVGICKSGEVIDRANVYYHYYLNSGKKIDEFITELTEAYKTVKASHGEIPNYEVTDELMDQYRDKYFNSDKVGAKYSSSTTEQRVDFSLWVTDLNSGRARELARIYALAADVALNKMLVFDNGTAGLIDLAGSVSGVSVSSDMSTMKIVIIAAVLGVVLALMTVYILRISDNTVKSKEQLEELSGANVIAYIENVPEVG
ncbi:MAG: hypothetical protein IJQ23_04840 [Clostridia bacterium]|nr:hypothetical protein [Clostridia bacterium]